MANEVDYAPRKYVGNGQTTEFQFDWMVFKENEIIVTLEDTYSGTINTAVLYNDYTVNISSYGGGKIIFNSAPSADKYITIERNVSNQQGTKYSTSTGFQGTQLEKDFDKISCNIQEIEYMLSKKYQFLDDAQITVTYPRFCVNRGGFDFSGSPNFLTYSNSILTAKADFIYTTGSGYTHEVYSDIILDISTYTDNSYNIFVNYNNFEYNLILLNNTIYKQKGKPETANANDIWFNLDTSPALAYIYTGSTWEQTELVPLGEIILNNNNAEIVINDYQIGNNIIKSAYNGARYIIALWGDETELVWSGPINSNYFKNNTNLRKIFIDTANCQYIGASEVHQSPFWGCSPRCRIFTNATEPLERWGEYWNYYDTTNQLEVIYGATRANYEEYQYV